MSCELGDDYRLEQALFNYWLELLPRLVPQPRLRLRVCDLEFSPEEPPELLAYDRQLGLQLCSVTLVRPDRLAVDCCVPGCPDLTVSLAEPDALQQATELLLRCLTEYFELYAGPNQEQP